ncbi:hypothetical protein [Mesorhizobium sp. IMUNJ 23033]|uniref:hypothetical protein n=1 Tax=Mesorhizobium sp. IMUNJ 23033 TaxID=3378039 RepID=UPI003850F45A
MSPSGSDDVRQSIRLPDGEPAWLAIRQGYHDGDQDRFDVVGLLPIGLFLVGFA